MRATGLIYCAATLILMARPASGQDKKQAAAPATTIRVKLPVGDVRIVYAESEEGMVLIVKSVDASVQAKRVYLGDGKLAVAFEADDRKGILTPAGPVNAASLGFKEGSVIKVPRGKRGEWGANRGEVYVHTPGLLFELQEE